MSNARQPTPIRQLNRTALLAMVLGCLGIAAAVAVRRAYVVSHNSDQNLIEAKTQLKAKQFNLALGYLNRHLKLHPNDLDALDLKAQLLSEGVHNAFQANDAIKVHELVLGRDPDNPKRQETRRRLIGLYLKVAGNSKTAVIHARDLIRRGARDAEAHRLLAAALEGAGAEGDAKATEEATREYEAALKIDPTNVKAAERLALLYRDKLAAPEKAAKVLDDLLAAEGATPESAAAARLARSRFYIGQNQGDRAAAEIEQGLKAAPGDLALRLAAAESATQRGDTAAARRHLEAIPPEAKRDDLRVKLIEGLIELNEQRPDEAIQSWRAALIQGGGNDASLTWRLAHVLIDIGRVREAEPHLAQYRRLIGGEDPNPAYRYLHAFLLLKRDRPAEAITELEAIRYKIDKTLEPHLYYLLGLAFEATRDTLRATESYGQATVLAPKWSDPWLALARLQGTERLGEAIQTLQRGLVGDEDDPRLLANLALLLWRRQMQRPRDDRSWKEVEAVLDRAKKVAPDSIELALVEADYLASVGKTDDALKVLEAACRHKPQSVAPWLARVNGLRRLGRNAEALKVLDEATAAAGPQSGFLVTRATILSGLGHGKEARAALSENLSRVPADQQPALWKAIGEQAQAQADRAGARHAYGEWARLQPDNPDPRIALLDLAIASGDDAAIRSEVEAMKDIGGPQGPYWRLARVEELLRERPGDETKDKEKEKEKTARFDEAEGLIKELRANQPLLPIGPLLEGRLRERRGQVDAAIEAYRKAVELKGGQVALRPLIALLIREKRDDELARLRKMVATLPQEVDRLATLQALKTGDRPRAEQLAAMMVQGDPQGLDSRLWQVQVLNDLGKAQEAEQAAEILIAQKPDEPAPWLQLLMLQVSRRDIPAATKTFAKIRERVKTDRPELFWAQCYRVLGDTKNADRSYEQALTKWPDDLTVRMSAISYYEQAGRLADAEASLRRLLKSDPGLGWASRKLAILLASHTGDFPAWKEALELIGPSARADDIPDDRLARAQVYARGPEPRHRKQAIQILEELSSELPGAAQVSETLAQILRDDRQLDRARVHAARAAGENATPNAIILYAGILLLERDYDETERQLDRLAKLAPDSLPAVEIRARLLAARGQLGAASKTLEGAFLGRAGEPDGLVIGEKMILLLIELKDVDAARRVAERVGRLGPRGACVQAIFLARHGQPDDALRFLRKAADAGDTAGAGSAALNLASSDGADARWLTEADRWLGQALDAAPDSPALVLKLALVRHLQKRFDDEVALYRKLIDLKPDSYQFLNNMAWTLSEDAHDPSEALRRANEALERVGWQGHILDTRGVILTRLGKFDEAARDLEDAATVLPVGPVYFHLARAYQKGQHPEAARKARERAKQLGLRPEQLQDSERADWDALLRD